MHNLDETKKTNVCKDVSNVTIPVRSISEIKTTSERQSLEALTTLNTRLNAIGRSNKSVISRRENQLQLPLENEQNSSGISFLKKRSVISFDDDLDFQQNTSHKKRKISIDSFRNATTESFEPHSDIAIVSPSRQKPTFVFNFDEIERPVVSPTPLNQTTVKFTNMGLADGIKSILTAPLALPPASSTKKSRRVCFCEEQPEVFYPPSVTPEPSSDCESE
jgi:preprotein translocase subunit SecD